MHPQILTPIRLGFILARVDVTCVAWPDVPYRGIDRMPYVISVEEDTELRRIGRTDLADLHERYWDAKDSRELFGNRTRIHQMRDEFASQGIDLEVIYSEVTSVPHDLDRYPDSARWRQRLLDALADLRLATDHFLARPQQLLFLGYDVSTLKSGFHSAIFQPGLVRVEPTLPVRLNANGLFDDADLADRYADAANHAIPGSLPFCVIGIWQSLHA